MLESKIQKQIMSLLSSDEHIYIMKLQAGSIRGYPDLCGCRKGLFFGFELKRSEKESKKTTGRIVLQKHRINKINKAGGLGRLVHPDNYLEVYQELVTLSDRTCS